MEYRRATHVSWRKIGDETIVVDLKAKTIIGLNDAGGAIWHALDAPGAPSRLAETLHVPDQGAGRLEALDRAVEGFLAELHSLGLVVCDAVPAKPAGQDQSGRPSLDGAFLPKIIWRDAIRNFGLTCAKQPGNPGCGALPTG